MARHAVAIRHVHFEDLGLFETALSAAGFDLRYCDIGVDTVSAIDPLQTDLLIVLGAPIGVNDLNTYPFLNETLGLLRARLAADRPTIGICLGAQLMARALGADVTAMGHKEIGFSALQLTAAGLQTSLRHLVDVPVLHWHGDIFALPQGAAPLAATAQCANQAFALGPNVIGVQFHPEARIDRLERWLIGHAAEISAAGIDPRDLRAGAQRHGAALEKAGPAFFAAWLAGLRF